MRPTGIGERPDQREVNVAGEPVFGRRNRDGLWGLRACHFNTRQAASKCLHPDAGGLNPSEQIGIVAFQRRRLLKDELLQLRFGDVVTPG